MLFNRVVKIICEFVFDPLFEATCKCRAVLEVQNRVPATSRSGQIVSVCGHFFLTAVLSRSDRIIKAISGENTLKRGDFEQ